MYGGGSGVNVEVKVGGDSVKVSVGARSVGSGGGVPHKDGWQAESKNINAKWKTKILFIFCVNNIPCMIRSSMYSGINARRFYTPRFGINYIDRR